VRYVSLSVGTHCPRNAANLEWKISKFGTQKLAILSKLFETNYSISILLTFITLPRLLWDQRCDGQLHKQYIFGRAYIGRVFARRPALPTSSSPR